MIDMKPSTSPEKQNAPLTRRSQGIDVMHVQPQPGQLYHLSGPGRAGKSMRCVAEHWVSHALTEGNVVHWVDGACRIDPGRFIPVLEALGADVESCLARLYLSRGFTLHQLDRQIERLSDEIAITRSPMVVVDGVLAMHGDDAISSLESRLLLRRHIDVLHRLAHRWNVAVVVITGTVRSPHTDARRVAYIQRHAQNHLEGAWRGQRRNKRLHLHHQRSGLRGQWLPFFNDPQTRFRLPMRHVNLPEHALTMRVLSLHHPER